MNDLEHVSALHREDGRTVPPAHDAGFTTHSSEYVRFDGPEVVEGVVLGPWEIARAARAGRRRASTMRPNPEMDPTGA